MKIHSLFKHHGFLFIVSILLVCQSSCRTTRIISSSNLPLPDSIKYTYVVHSQIFKFRLEKSTFSGGILEGKIKAIYKDDKLDEGRDVHLYVASDSVIKIDTGRIVRVPINEITKVTYRQYSSVKTIILVSSLVILPVLIIIGGIWGQSPFPSP